jgi:aspartyl-tRNA(Asn)/glutamyl-tRNA(Gln) amidotransferase subunit A
MMMSAAPAPSAVELVAAYREGIRSPVEVVADALMRIAHGDPALNAFCLVDADGAREQARASADRWSRDEPLGTLDGVPVAVKDVFLTRGQPTLRGSLAIDPDGPWEHDAPAVAALRRHGAVLIGKTTTSELGWKCVTDSPRHGVTRNPWDPSRTPGGSSGGSAAALAAGMVPLALGTDAAGSIRIPCGFCGVVGIKPTRGRVPLWPPSPFGAISHGGPMARTVADVALLLDAISDHDAAASAPAGESLLDTLGRGVDGLRVAFSPRLGHVDVDPEVAACVAAAVAALGELGARVEHADPGFADPAHTFDVLWSHGAAQAVAALGDVDPLQLDPGLRAIFEVGRKRTENDVSSALRAQRELGETMDAFHRSWDLLVTPTLPLPAFAAGRDAPPGADGGQRPSWSPFTYPFNLTGQPAASVPCGFTATGLPVGMQIIGPPGADALVLRAARAYEADRPQSPTYPPPGWRFHTRDPHA